jgi:hypothetical protein
VSTPLGGLLTNIIVHTTAALAVLAAAGAAVPARAAQPACGFVGGGLPDPGQTQRCLADRYKAPAPKPAAGSATAPASAPAPAPSNAASSKAAAPSGASPPVQGS